MNTYRETVKMIEKKGKQNYRMHLVKVALEFNESFAAREFKTTRTTVRKWVKRYQEGGYEALQDAKRTRRPRKVCADVEKKIVETRKKYKSWGARRIRSQLDLCYSPTTIHKILMRHGLVKKIKKRYKRRRDMSEKRKECAPFEKIQVDIKYLTDIPELSPLIWDRLIPLYQITARDYKTGAVFICYCFEKTSANCGVFLDYLCYFLELNGIDLSNTVFQTDNGKEFVSDSIKRMSFFEEIATIKYGAAVHRIPPARPTYNSDVETVHRLIEDEFYCVEEFSSKEDFLLKAFSYQVFFNGFRTNRNRGDKTPVQILKEEGKGKWGNALFLPPIITDYEIKSIEKIKQGVYFYGVPPIKSSKKD